MKNLRRILPYLCDVSVCECRAEYFMSRETATSTSRRHKPCPTLHSVLLAARLELHLAHWRVFGTGSSGRRLSPVVSRHRCRLRQDTAAVAGVQVH